MAAPLIEAGDCTVSGSNTAAATWAVSHPNASIGDLLIWNIAWDDSTTTTDVTEPAGSNSETLSEINATAVASASTEVRGKCWYTVCTGAWSAGTLTFTPSADETWTATVIRVPAGEFDAADPIGNVLTRSSANTTDTSVENPVGDLAANDGTGTLVWFAFVDADPLSGTNPSGWTIRQSQDLGAVAHGIATRDTQTTNGETVAETTWAIAGDSWAGISYVVRGPPVYAVAGTVRFVGQTPSVEYTNLGQNAWAPGAWASGAWATGAWDVAAAGGETVAPSVGAYRFVGQVPTVGFTHSVSPTLGTFRFVGQTPSVGYTHSVLPSVGAYRFVGQTPTLGQSQSVAPSVGTLRFVGLTPSTGASASVVPSVGAFRFVGLAPTVGFTHSVSPSVGTVQFAGQVPVAGFTHSATPTAGVLRFDGQAPSIPADGYAWAIGAWGSGAWAAGAWAPGSLDATASPTVGTVRLVGQTPTVGYTDAQAVAPLVGTVRFDGAAPSVGFTHSVAPAVGTFRLDGLQPTVTWGDNMTVAPSVGSLVFVGQQPTVLNLSGYAWHPNAWASGAWAYGAWAPDSPSASVSPSVGTVRLVGQQPTLETGAKTVAPSAGVLRFVGQQPPLGDTSALVDFDTPAQSLVEGADLQTFRVLVRKTTGTNPTVDIALYEGGTWVADLVTGTAVTSEVGQIVEATWDAALLADVSGANVQCFVYGNSSETHRLRSAQSNGWPRSLRWSAHRSGRSASSGSNRRPGTPIRFPERRHGSVLGAAAESVGHGERLDHAERRNGQVRRLCPGPVRDCPSVDRAERWHAPVCGAATEPCRKRRQDHGSRMRDAAARRQCSDYCGTSAAGCHVRRRADQGRTQAGERMA